MAYFRCGGGLPTQTKSTTATTSQQTVTPDNGYVLESVTVNPQSHSSYYPSSSSYYSVDGSETINLGANHNYRYIRVSSSGIHPSGTKTITTRSSSIDVESYKYADTTGVPNSHSGTSSSTITSNTNSYDLGSTHSYRYIKVAVPASSISHSGTYDDGEIHLLSSYVGEITIDMGAYHSQRYAKTSYSIDI